jgi:hypothetical protein
MDNFVKKNLNIAADQITASPEDGGTGMFKINEFLAAQRCMWLSRAYRLQIDNWRYDLKFHSSGNNILLIRPCDVDANTHPILHGMVLDYQSFYSKFCAANGNYKRAYIFDNDCFKIGPAYNVI